MITTEPNKIADSSPLKRAAALRLLLALPPRMWHHRLGRHFVMEREGAGVC